MSYSPEIAAALSGASVGRLSYWRSSRSGEAPLLRPALHLPRSRVSYSFPDVVALRTFVYLRAKDVPLQRVRKAVKALRELGATEHLSSYSLVADGRDVVWRISEDEAVALTGQPGQQVIAQMVDIVAGFQGETRRVVPLYEPAEGLRVDPEVRGGYPVIEGTRIPFDLVAGLMAEGIEAVTSFYPSVGLKAAQGALTFARHVANEQLLAA